MSADHQHTLNINDRAAGIRAIIALQAVGGIVETYDQASRGWDHMTNPEKWATLRIAALLITEKGEQK